MEKRKNHSAEFKANETMATAFTRRGAGYALETQHSNRNRFGVIPAQAEKDLTAMQNKINSRRHQFAIAFGAGPLNPQTI